MKYDVDYFIRKFKAIPEERWLSGAFSNGNNGCANGLAHIEKIGMNEFIDFFRSHKNLFSEPQWGNYTYSQQVNNGDDPLYQQPTPKQRILAALYDIKKLQQGEVKEPVQPEHTPVKVIHHYVSVPESIKASVPVCELN